MSERDLDLRLGDGRTLSYAVLGDADAARTVVVLDGPGSRGLARAAAPEAERRGLRLIAPDRPGFMRSTPVQDRSFGAVAGDVLELAGAVGAERFGVVAQSGGTPYAVALAGRAPDRVAALAFAGAIAPFTDAGALDDVSGPMRVPFLVSRRAPFLLRPLFGAAARQVAKDPEKVAARVRDAAPEADRRILAEPRYWDLHVRVTREALASPRAVAQEARLLGRAWDVDFAAVTAPVALWVGEEDVTHPPSMARLLAARLGGAPVRVVPGAATFALLPVLGDVLAFAADGV